jgi:hypothetical protein
MKIRYAIYLNAEPDFAPYTGEGNFRLAYEGRVAIGNPLEALFEMFNLNHPADYQGRSLSVGDLVRLDIDGRSYYYSCEPAGWKLQPSASEMVAA